MSDTSKSPQVQTYSLALEYDPTDGPPVNLKVLNVADSKNSLGWLEVVGQVENQGASTSTFTKVIGTFYGANDKVIYADFTYTSPSDIESQSKQSFKITIADQERSNKITRYTIVAESDEYTSVPEFSVPIAVATLALSVMAFAVIRKNLQRRRRTSLLSSF
jgi:hypothetical protein